MLLSVQCVGGGSGVQVALLSTNLSTLERHERCQMQAESQILHPHYRVTCDLKGSVKTGQTGQVCVCVCVRACVCVRVFVCFVGVKATIG